MTARCAADSASSTATAWARAGLRGYFTRGVVLSQPEALKSLASASGLDAQQAEAAWGDTLWKARLKRANDEAIAAGVFGAPFFFVDGEPPPPSPPSASKRRASCTAATTCSSSTSATSASSSVTA